MTSGLRHSFVMPGTDDADPATASPSNWNAELVTDETDTSLVLKPDGSGGAKFAAASGGGGLLGASSYASATDTNPNRASTTTAALDATNFAVTFTAPASGVVVVRFGLRMAPVGGGLSVYLGILEGAALLAEALSTQFSFTGVEEVPFTARLTGVSAGSHTYKAAYRATANSFNYYIGPTFGQIWMTVEAAP